MLIGFLLAVLGLTALNAHAEPASTPAASSASVPQSVPHAETPEARALWSLTIDAPQDVRKLLEIYLDLSRFRTTSNTTDAITRTELHRLVAAAPAQVRELLQPLGYFHPTVSARIEQDASPQAGTTATVRVVVAPGEPVTVGRLTLEILGAVQEQTHTGDAAAAQQLVARLRNDWPLVGGQPFRQSVWNDAKTTLLSTLKSEGYVGAAYSGTVAQVDVATNQVRLFVVVDSGPRYQFGDVEIEGLERYDRRVITKLIPFKKGDTYAERALSDFQERVQKLGLFEAVSVSMEPDDSRADAIPIRVKVREMLRRQTTIGLGVGSNGDLQDTLEPRLTVEHMDRQVFGQKWTSKTKGQIAARIRLLQQDFLSYPQNGFYRNLISGSLSRDESQSKVEVRNSKFRMGRTQDGERIERLYYGEWQRANTITSGVQNGSSALSANYEWIWRDLDNLLLPTQGLAASAKLSFGRAFAPAGPLAGDAGQFGRIAGRMTYYHPLGRSWYAQGRIEAGEVLSRHAVAVPYTLLFRAGGDESVRGYDYQELGPEVNGAAVGGRVITTASLELARPFSSATPAWWWAIFADAGDAAPDWQHLSVQQGYGLGLRWRSPVGPLRLDVAYGARDHTIRPYFSVGITF